MSSLTYAGSEALPIGVKSSTLFHTRDSRKESRQKQHACDTGHFGSVAEFEKN